jgi:uncharacterized membrane protein YedE/YeeE
MTSPTVIEDMLLLKEFDVFFLMGTAILIAAIGLRVLRALGVRAFVSGEPISWTRDRPRQSHVVGSLLFGAAWSVTGTCPGPMAAMIGEGTMGGLLVATGLIGGIALHNRMHGRLSTPAATAHTVQATARRVPQHIEPGSCV